MSTYPFNNESAKAVSDEDGRPLLKTLGKTILCWGTTHVISEGSFEFNHKVVGMVENAILVVLPKETSNNVCIVAICPYSSVWHFIRENISGPIDRLLHFTWSACCSKRGIRGLWYVRAIVGEAKALQSAPNDLAFLRFRLVRRWLGWWREDCGLPSRSRIPAKSMNKNYA